MKPVETEELTIHFDGKTCIHARRCVLGLPKVFDPEARPWIQPGGASTDDLISVIEACPSGALSYTRKDGPQEITPETNTVRVWENGPLEVRGEIHIEGETRTRALLCRCGKTENSPFCNNAHLKGFTATGLPEFREDKDRQPEETAGPIEVVARENGPLLLKGNMEIIGGDGRRVARVGHAAFCRCGSFGDKPFCDGSHNKIGFQKPPVG